MMDKYKDILYKNYTATHNNILHGEITIEKIVKNFPVFRYYYEQILPDDKNAAILEVGCGNGNFVHFLNESGYHKVQGIDLSVDQIESGKKIGIQNIFVSEMFDFLSHETHKYDCIIARDVIEHLTRQEAFEAISAISTSLNKDGRFIMQVPNGQGLFYTSIFYGDYTHEMPYTEQTVRQLFLNTGFGMAKCFPVEPYPNGVKGMIRRLLWKYKTLHTRFWKMVESGSPKGIFTSNLIAVGYK